MKFRRMTLIVLVLIFITIKAIPAYPGLDQSQDPEIISISNDPLYPLVNETVNFLVIIQNPLNTPIDNVTLNYGYEEFNTTTEMQIESSTTFNYSVKFLQPGLIQYQAAIYANNEIVSSSSTNSFTVRKSESDVAPVNIEFGIPTILQVGNFTISTPDNGLELNLSVQDSINITIDIVNPQSNSPSNSELLSAIYDINVNDTSELTNITLAISYSPFLLDRLGSAPQYLRLEKRENENDDWEITEYEIDKENNQLISHPTSFSQWVVTAQIATLKFLPSTNEIVGTPLSFVSYKTVVGNFGGVTAHNVTIRVIKPDQLISANSSLSIIIEQLDPMQNVTFTWTFSGDIEGEYNLLAIVEADNGEGDLSNLRIVIEEAQNSQNSISSSSSISDSSDIKISNIGIFVSMSLITVIYINVLRTKRRR